jgi:hypothetical protein
MTRTRRQAGGYFQLLNESERVLNERRRKGRDEDASDFCLCLPDSNLIPS